MAKFRRLPSNDSPLSAQIFRFTFVSKQKLFFSAIFNK